MNSSGRGAKCRLLAVDDDEIGIDFRLQHGLADRQEFPGMAKAQFEANRLASRKTPQIGDEAHQFRRRREGGMTRGRKTSLPSATPRIAAISDVTYGARQDAAMAGLSALAQFDFDHLESDRWRRTSANPIGIESAIGFSAAEIARTDLPDDIAAFLLMIGAKATLARIMAGTRQRAVTVLNLFQCVMTIAEGCG